MANASSRQTKGLAANGLSGLRLTCLAATIMIVAQAALGYGVAASVTVPSADKNSGIFAAIGRSLANGPVALGVHAGLGLVLILTAVSAVVRAILARRNAVLWLSIVGLLAVLVANVTGARFVSTGHDSDSKVMEVTAIIALVCYLLSLLALRKQRASTQ
jgi:hypothetical protein